MNPIRSFLDRYEWSYETVAPDVLRVTFAGEDEREYDLYIAQSEAWLHFAVTPLTTRPTDGELTDLAPSLLQRNQQMRLVRLAIDDENDLTLLADLPLSALSYPAFATTLDALSYYAKDLGREIGETVKAKRRGKE